ncbi:tectonic-like complex member MKS1 [Oncorhynchus clarkii lewisi]|uniref:tectonic-like complex member MKS1 n=1 Tax=Oncorhynchus clarkii lewisi TaxID=490388 RepID=UPI0039B980E0
MANVRHRRQDRRPVDRTIPKSRLFTWDPSEDFEDQPHGQHTCTDHAHHGEPGTSGQTWPKGEGMLVCTIRADGNGVVTIKSDFNKGKEPNRPVTRTR